ncbi:MAG: glycosyltransferase family protein [Parachlamydiales bacterium]|nr:glycosyltransferase family protein [Parachlamydiales bacterium]
MKRLFLVLSFFCLNAFADESIDASQAMASDAYFKMGLKSYQEGNNEDAMTKYVKAIDYNKGYAKPYWGIGILLSSQSKWQAAITNFKSGLSQDPQLIPAYDGLGIAYENIGQPYQAILTYLEGYVFAPQFDSCCTRFDLSIINTYEDTIPSEKIIDERLIQVTDLNKNRANQSKVLVTTNESIPDLIQFIRYINCLNQKGFKVYFRPPVEMAQMLTQSTIKTIILDSLDEDEHFDLQIPLSCLPSFFQEEMKQVYTSEPYLLSDRLLKDKMSQLYQSPKFKVGIVWNSTDSPFYSFSIPFEELKPLLDIQGIQFYSLQMGDSGNEMTLSTMIDTSDNLNDWRKRLAVIDSMDLMICVDGAMLQTAAAMGKPVWGLLSKPASWRWMMQGDQSQWYSSVRLFRQTESNKWHPVIQNVKEALNSIVQNKQGQVSTSEEIDYVVFPDNEEYNWD